MRVANLMSDYVLLLWIACIAVSRSVLAGQAPRFTREPESVIAKIHSPVKFYCDVEPETAEVKWTLNHNPVGSDKERGISIEDNGRTLHILSFKHTRSHQPHVGNYQCIVSNDVGTLHSSIASLERAYLVGFKRSNGSVVTVDVTVGNTAHIPCQVPKSAPRAFTVFEVNSTTIDSGTNSDRHLLIDDGSLQIGNVEMSDQGKYHCIAINTVSHHKRSAKSRVHLKVHAPSGNVAPHFVVKPKINNEILLGETLTLQCIMGGFPAPVITWEKYGGELPNRAKSLLGNLVIENVQLQDSGTYICRGDNGQGGLQTEIAMVDVQEPPRITVPPTDQTVLVGGTAVFTCMTPGRPKVQHTWSHDGELLVADSHMEIDDTSLTVNNAQSVHAGMYQCWAKNKVGQTHSEARLIVKNASSMEGNGTEVEEELLLPSLPEIEQLTKTSVRVSWTLYPGPQVKMFVVQYKLRKSKWRTAGTAIPANQNEYIVEKLKPRSKYSFRVTVKYQDGASRTSEKAVYCLVKNVPSRREQQDGTGFVSPPVILRPPMDVTISIGDRLHLPCTPQGPARLYWLKEGLWFNVSRSERFHILDNGTLQIERVRLSDEALYTCIVSNTDDVFLNASAFVTVRETLDSNATVSVDVGGSRLKPTPTADCEDKKPQKKKCKKGRKNCRKTESADNRVPPTIPKITQASDNSVMLQWTVPENDGLKIDFFKVQYNEKNRHSRKMVGWKTIDEDLPDSMLIYEVTGLKPGGMYKFRVAAMYVNNNFLFSPVTKTFKLRSTVVQKPPNIAPMIVNVERFHDGMKVYWQYERHVPFAVDGFMVYYRPYDPTSQTPYKDKMVGDSLTRDISLVNLEPETTYELQVSCYNTQGIGPLSNKAVKKTTKAGAPLSIPDLPGGQPVDPEPRKPTDGSSLGDKDVSDLHESIGSHNSPNNPNRSNELLYMILGIVLGVMVLLLVVFMVLCWWRQRQQKNMMAAMDAKYRNKFQDPAQQIYNSQMTPKKYTNGFLLNGINGHANHVGRQSPPYQNGTMNINVNPLTDVDNQEVPADEDSDATKLAESSPEIPNGYPRTCTNCNSTERQHNLENLQNILNTDDVARIDYSNFMGTGSSQHSGSGESRPQFTTFIGSQGPVARPEQQLANGSRNGSATYLNRSCDQLSPHEQSQPSQAKHKRRKKRPAAQSREQRRDQATNTDISSNEGTLESTHQRQTHQVPASHPVNQNTRYVNSYDCED